MEFHHCAFFFHWKPRSPRGVVLLIPAFFFFFCLSVRKWKLETQISRCLILSRSSCPRGKKKRKRKKNPSSYSPGAFPGARRHAVRHVGTYLRRKRSRFDWFSLVTVWNSWLFIRSSKEDFVTPPLIWPPPWSPGNSKQAL